MNTGFIVDRIINGIVVKAHDVNEAKFFILGTSRKKILSITLLDQYVKETDSRLPESISYSSDEELDRLIHQCCKYYQKAISFCEAVMSLQRQGIFFPTSERQLVLNTSIPVSTSGWSTSLQLRDIQIMIPQELHLSYSLRGINNIFDKDVFLQKLDISNANDEIKSAILDSIRCFNAELYQPSIVMLGKAVEGAWIELGLSIFYFEQKSEVKKLNDIEYIKGTESISRKMKKVLKSYSDRDLFENLHKQSDINHRVLEETYHWSELIRESRNAIHFGVQPNLPNDYEKVSILLLSANKHFKAIYQVIAAASVTSIS